MKTLISGLTTIALATSITSASAQITTEFCRAEGGTDVNHNIFYVTEEFSFPILPDFVARTNQVTKMNSEFNQMLTTNYNMQRPYGSCIADDASLSGRASEIKRHSNKPNWTIIVVPHPEP